MEKNDPVRLIRKETPLSSMGSCFARHAATYLKGRGYNYLVTEPPGHESAQWGRIYNTACRRQIFEYSFQDWQPLTRWWNKGEMVLDPFRCEATYVSATASAASETRHAASYNALSSAEVIVLTLGLVGRGATGTTA